MNKVTCVALGLIMALSVEIGAIQSALAHGYVTQPASRSYLCNKGNNIGCGAVQYEPQSVEGTKGFPDAGPSDGAIASGGNTRFLELNQQSPTRWYKVIIHPGSNKFIWKLTATHRTTDWQYYITRQGWDTSKPLSRSSFELEPFCQIDGKGEIPLSQVQHTCTVPSNRSGYHVILAVWNIADTTNAFYQAIDVDILK
ncbi:lytic polysaccharide monooxygenase [Enterobacter bugandensis]|uniref:lytic polysaccharide monooxygenase n=1 Tax=Enterobacter bugandensis TaxID=881260 RepID=UPI00094950FE|nr:lytic polysaccharide monooxygenase [Enterobacter bugandensis]